ncbi:MAG: class I SAM-dependent methyltransferase [bacterium]
MEGIRTVIKLPLDIERVKGFLDSEEGEALYKYAAMGAGKAPCFEIGAYCGKSTVYLGSGCRQAAGVLYSLDHHRGSEEHQPGEEYHDGDLMDVQTGNFDSFREFRLTLERAGLEDIVIPIVTSSAIAARGWVTPLSMVFIDGGHSFESALGDYRYWAGHIIPGGILAIHDIFPDPAKGGQAPYEVWKTALASALFEEVEIVKTLGILRRI